jgi:hypothetical protein
MPKVKPEEGIAQTVIENDVDGAPKTTTLQSPWGSKVTVAADQADVYKDAGYSASK